LFKLERRTSSTGSYSTLIDTLNLMAQDQSAPPANLLLSYTGSTGDNTNFHDITNIQVCTQQPSTPIEIGNPVHHIRLDYNPGLTCESNPVTVTACANATCTAPHANLAFVDLDVTYPNSPVTTMRVNLTNGVGTVSLSNTVQGNAAIDVSGNTLQSCNGATPATAACSMYFSDTAFKFYRDDVSTAGLANQVAGVQGGGYLRAVKTNTDTKACEARTEGLKNVAMSFSCINPNNCSIDLEKVLTLKNNRPLATTETFFDGDEEGSVKNVSLNFDEDGYAPLGINYLDVGQLRLSASLSLPANGNDPAVTLTGLSDPFVVRPHRINVTTALSSTTAASPNAVNPQTSDAGAGFVAAGEDFQLYVSPVNALGNLTPNYGNETVAESVEVQFGQLLYPADGVDGTLTADADFDKVDSGAYINRFHSDQVSWNEVGTLTITASVKGSDYLGTGLGAAAVSDPYTVGRFYPADFSLDSSSLSNSCNNFSYMGQPGIGLNYILSARNVDGQVTENYGANFAPKATVALVLEHDDEGTDLAERLNETSGTWQSGVMQIALSTLNFSRLADVTLIDGPFSVLKAGLQISDSIDSRDFKATNKNMNADTQGLCDTACNAVQLSGSLDVRYGRFTLLNGYGPENEDLPIVLQSQYWDGDRFVRNTTDNCSHFTPDKLLVTGITTSKGGTAGNVESGENPYQHLFIPAPNVLGTAELEYEIPEDQEFMQFPWNGVVLGNPTAEAQFGRYRGNKRQIFWQERLN
jgi:MSHA biogenesis protein MshQ